MGGEKLFDNFRLDRSVRDTKFYVYLKQEINGYNWELTPTKSNARTCFLNE